MSHICPCCDSTVTEFVAFNGRDNARCPLCDSAERHRLLSIYLSKMGYSFGKLFHFSPDKCLVNKLKSISSSYQGGGKETDLTNLPFSNEFDVMVTSHVLEKVSDDRLALSQIIKSLVPGGCFITMISQKVSLRTTVEDPRITLEQDRLKQFGNKDHLRCYGIDFSERLKNAGFFVKIYYPEKLEEVVDNMICDDKQMIIDDTEADLYGIHMTKLIYECIKL